MAKPPFGALSCALAGLATALSCLTFELRADGYEQYVESVAHAAVQMYVASALVVVTWVRARRTHSG